MLAPYLLASLTNGALPNSRVRREKKMGGITNYKKAEREFRKCTECGDRNFTDYCNKQIERQQQLVKIEELKRKKEQQGF